MARFFAPTKKLRRLSVLLAIEQNPNVSQHVVGKLTNLSSAMVNNYIKQMQRENLITMAGESNRTQTYHLTPAGRKELSELVNLYSDELAALYSCTQSAFTGSKRHKAQACTALGEEENEHGTGD